MATISVAVFATLLLSSATFRLDNAIYDFASNLEGRLPSPDIAVLTTNVGEGAEHFWTTPDIESLITIVRSHHPKVVVCVSAFCPKTSIANRFDAGDLRADTDGVFRHVALWAAAGVEGPFLIPYRVRSFPFNQISAISILRHPENAFVLQNHLVLVGNTSLRFYRTPNESPTSQVEVAANVVNGIATGGLIRTAPQWLLFIVGSLMIYLLTAGMIAFKTQEAIIFAALMFLLPLSASILAVGVLQWWAPQGAYISAIAFVIPYCRWRRLHMIESGFIKRLRTIKIFSRTLEDIADYQSVPNISDEESKRNLLFRAFGGAIYALQNLTRFTFNRLSDPIIYADIVGKILITNQPAVSLADRYDVTLDPGSNVLPLLGLFRSAEHNAMGHAGGKDWNGALPEGSNCSLVHGQDPEGRPAQIRFTPIFHLPSEIGGWAIQISSSETQILNPRQSETALRQREEALQLLSHDMRSPQITILAMIAKGDLDEAGVGVRHRVERQVRKTIHLAESFVRLAHAESDAYLLIPVDLGHLLEEALDEVWALARSAGVHVKLEPWTDEYVIEADRTLIIRALINLLDNAIKFSPPGRWVVAGLARATLNGRPAIACSIADQAGGMDEKQLSTLFERFATFRRGPDESIGVGLGLATVRAVANRHNGKVMCESALGIGSVFTMTLPLMPSFGPV